MFSNSSTEKSYNYTLRLFLCAYGFKYVSRSRSTELTPAVFVCEPILIS